MPEPPFSLPAAELELAPGKLDPEQVLEGAPEVSELVLSTSEDGRVERGVWQITEGGRTVSRVHEALRKVYLVTVPRFSAEPGG